jgi:hypothetical protein
MKLASFDIEICDELTPSPDGSVPAYPRLSCAALAIQDTPEAEPCLEYFTSSANENAMTNEQVLGLLDTMLHLARHDYKFLTWNGVAFDMRLIAHFSGDQFAPDVYRLAWQDHIDMMLLVTFQTGYRLGLDAALLGAGLESKLHQVTLTTGEVITDMSGARAPALWCAGERQAVLDYLAVDVIQPLKLARRIEAERCLRWTSKKGRAMFINTDLLTVKDAYHTLPQMDCSWLPDPILRQPYINQYLPGVLE